MKTYHVDSQAVALGLEDKEIHMAAALVRLCLKQQGIRPWDSVETEIFSYEGENLLLARPAPPVSARTDGRGPRLKRR